MREYKVFVLSVDKPPYRERRKKYTEDARYELFPGLWWEDISEHYLEQYTFMWSAQEQYKKCAIACAMSHVNLLQKIANEDLKNVVILEDDAVLDFDRLNILDEIDEMCFVGGKLEPPILSNSTAAWRKNQRQQLRDNFKSGINLIDPAHFTIWCAHGYFIPNALSASRLLKLLSKDGKKKRAIDTHYVRLQKKNLIKKFVYPALATSVVKEARNSPYNKGKGVTDNRFYY